MPRRIGFSLLSLNLLMLGCASAPASSSSATADLESRGESPAAAVPAGQTTAPPAAEPPSKRPINGGGFELYAEAGVDSFTSTHECKRFTHLTITGNTAKLREIGTDTCKENVDPDTRSYELTATIEGCLHVYAGRSATGSIRIEDYRAGASTCETPSRAELVVTEKRGTAEKHSFSAKVTPGVLFCEAPPQCDGGHVERPSAAECSEAASCHPRHCGPELVIWCEVIDG
jgi:hypothetical protein